jgi:hypothetical protein
MLCITTGCSAHPFLHITFCYLDTLRINFIFDVHYIKFSQTVPENPLKEGIFELMLLI